MRVIPRRLVCCLLVAGICLATTAVETAFGQKTEGPPSPDKPSASSSTPDSAAVRTPKEITSKSTGMKLALIPAGTFLMGSSVADVKVAVEADSNFKEEFAKAEQPQHRVKISRPLYMGVYEVTQEEYESVMGTNPSWYSKTGSGKGDVSGLQTKQFPVEMVSWFDAVEFCNKLSEKDGYQASYTLSNVERADGSIKSATVAKTRGNGYRLPTEAEWEYACRAGSTTLWHTGNTLDALNEAGWWGGFASPAGNSERRTNRVGQKTKNEFGLYDMHGNVWEWCFDVYDESAYGKRGAEVTADPIVSNGSGIRALRGGSWVTVAGGTRTAVRLRFAPGFRSYDGGFRVAVETAFGQKTEGPPGPDKPSASSSTPDSATVRTSKSTGMKLELIPAKTFQMGSSAAEVKVAMEADSTLKEEYTKAEQPQHSVKISKPFYMGVYEVTQEEYESVMGTNPSWFSNTGGNASTVSELDTSKFPVEGVSWFDAVEFCNKLSEKDDFQAYYTLSNVERAGGSIKSATVSTTGGNGYRLPTEAEWEYACRAGSTTLWHTGNTLDALSEAGWWGANGTPAGNSEKRTNRVGQKTKNEFGLYDMHGNVWEWCFDVYDGSAYGKRGSEATADPMVTSGSVFRVLRGGSWNADAWGARAAFRNGYAPVSRTAGSGFRVVR